MTACMELSNAGSMKRTQVQLDERTYQVLRRRAFESGSSLSAVVRDLLRRALFLPAGKRRRTLRDFPFVGSGRSRKGRLAPVSERHDEAFAQAIRPERRR